MIVRATKSAANEEIAAIQELMGDLEKRLRRLSGETRHEASEASDEIGNFVNGMLERIKDRLRENTSDITQTVTDSAKRLSDTALNRLTEQIKLHPFTILSLAVGFGFFVGLSSRR